MLGFSESPGKHWRFELQYESFGYKYDEKLMCDVYGKVLKKFTLQGFNFAPCEVE